jgi:hypothetical protein
VSEQHSAENDGPILDWRDLAPEPEWHECDCRFCDMGGDQEPIEWPLLIVADGDGVNYVTDRFMMIRADLAPIPEGYKGVVLPDRPNASDLLASLAGISTEPPVGRHFRWSTLKALELTGWDLRLLQGSDKRVAVVDREGLPIGVAIASSHECDDVRAKGFTRPYVIPPGSAEGEATT